jgi:peroxin-1
MRKVKVKYSALHSSLVNLPLSVYGPLVSAGVVSNHSFTFSGYRLTASKRPQVVAVHLSNSKKDKDLRTAYVGWTGLASSPSSGRWKAEDSLESIEIDPQLCTSLGFVEGEVVGDALYLKLVF